VSRGYLGINIRNLDYNTAQAWGLEDAEGALVVSVESSTPAGKAGLKHGDVILSVDGRKIKTTRDLIGYVSNKGPNSSVKLEVWRDRQKLDREVKLGERPGQQVAARDEEPEGESGIDWLGVQYQDITSTLRNAHGIPEGTNGVLVSSVAPTSPLYEQGVRAGTILAEVNGKPIESVDSFESLVKEAKSGSYLRFYGLQLAQRGEPLPFFAVVQVP
jgi:serine protease Do